MSDEVLISIITGAFTIAGGVIIVVLGARLNGKVNMVRADAKATRTQVENGHDTNLREEADERHTENKDLLADIAARVEGLETWIRKLAPRIAANTEHIDELTHPRSQYEPPARHRMETTE